MDQALVDNLVMFFALTYYLLLVIVYVLRAHRKSGLEIRLGPLFSAQLIPFIGLWVVNLINGFNVSRLVALAPVIIYLLYDLWYRQITLRKPVHHPEHWPLELKVYLLLLMVGSIGLNWYGYIVSELYGRALVCSFFVMMGSFGYYQYMHNKSKKTRESNKL
jgi:lysylphosphatidylglycerol synthetase-like protein (DUF2156 family)